MRRTWVCAMVGALVLLAWVAQARGPKARQGEGSPPWQNKCVSLEALDLSREQRSALERLNAEYSFKVARMREDLLARRWEVEALLRDAEAKEESIRAKAQEMVLAHNQLREKLVEYQLWLRAILSPEQLNKWCTLMGPGPGPGRWGKP